MKICVLISCYNYATFLRDAVNSAISQTRRVDEIVIVDDGSTDSSAEIARELAAKDKRIKVIEQQNTGQLGAFEAGIQETRADWIFLLDADDKWRSNHVETCLGSLLDDPKTGWIYSQLSFFGDDPSEPPYQYKLPYGPLGESCLWALASFGISNFPFLATATSAMAFRADLIRPILPFSKVAQGDWKVCADEVLVVALSLLGARRVALRDVTVDYRVHAKNHFAGTQSHAENSRAGARLRLKSELMTKLGMDERSVTKLWEEFAACPNKNSFLRRRYAQAALSSLMPIDRRILNSWKIYSTSLEASDES
mgnify:CR=1 FL=1